MTRLRDCIIFILLIPFLWVILLLLTIGSDEEII